MPDQNRITLPFLNWQTEFPSRPGTRGLTQPLNAPDRSSFAAAYRRSVANKPRTSATEAAERKPERSEIERHAQKSSLVRSQTASAGTQAEVDAVQQRSAPSPTDNETIQDSKSSVAYTQQSTKESQPATAIGDDGSEVENSGEAVSKVASADIENSNIDQQEGKVLPAATASQQRLNALVNKPAPFEKQITDEPPVAELVVKTEVIDQSVPAAHAHLAAALSHQKQPAKPEQTVELPQISDVVGSVTDVQNGNEDSAENVSFSPQFNEEFTSDDASATPAETVITTEPLNLAEQVTTEILPVTSESSGLIRHQVDQPHALPESAKQSNLSKDPEQTVTPEQEGEIASKSANLYVDTAAGKSAPHSQTETSEIPLDANEITARKEVAAAEADAVTENSTMPTSQQARTPVSAHFANDESKPVIQLEQAVEFNKSTSAPVSATLPEVRTVAVPPTPVSTLGTENVAGNESAQFESSLAVTAFTKTAETGVKTTVTPTLDLQQGDALQKLSNWMQLAAEAGKSLKIRLNPPELGTLQIEVRMQGGEMMARLETETAAARSLILEQLQSLKDSLWKQGLSLEKFEVELNEQLGRETEQSQQRQQQQSRDEQESQHLLFRHEEKTSEAEHEGSPEAVSVVHRSVSVEQIDIAV